LFSAEGFWGDFCGIFRGFVETGEGMVEFLLFTPGFSLALPRKRVESETTGEWRKTARVEEVGDAEGRLEK
jgi:hypothetical protein